MSLVADISVVLAWLFEEQQTPAALDVLTVIETEGLVVPNLWWSELENGLLMAERRASRTTDECVAFLDLVRHLPIRTDDVLRYRISDDILRIGRTHQLTAYDAAYVELALREAIPLATFDDAIRRCAPQAGLTLLPADV